MPENYVSVYSIIYQMADFFAGGYESVENRVHLLVDVRDVAEGLILLYEKGEAEGRYICTAHVMETGELVDMLKRKYPDYNYPKK